MTLRMIFLALIVIPIFLMIDLLWLGVFVKNFYSQELGDLARRQGTALAPRWGAALLVYILIPAGLLLFVRPLIGPGDHVWQAFAWGATFGLVVYGVYDLTNLAILDKWTLTMTIADICWGCVLCGNVSIVMQYAEKWLNK